jgi:hypothetical protein
MMEKANTAPQKTRSESVKKRQGKRKDLQIDVILGWGLE